MVGRYGCKTNADILEDGLICQMLLLEPEVLGPIILLLVIKSELCFAVNTKVCEGDTTNAKILLWITGFCRGHIT